MIFAAVPCVVFGEEVHISSTSRIDWQEGTVHIDVIADVGNLTSFGKARMVFVERLQREIGSLFCTALYDVRLDSYRTVKDVVETDGTLLKTLMDIGSAAKPANIHLNTTLSRLTASYEFEIYPDVMRVFTTHTRPVEPLVLLEYEPTIRYSGIVIYAKETYPVHGEDPAGKNPERFRPSLKPKLFDTQMELVAEAEMMDPEYILRWGAFGYTDSADYLRYKDRIGATPIFSMARAVFGDFRTDLLIPVDVARKLLATPENRELIRQGRILVICDLPAETVID
jgi:hypothetical protein